MGSRKSKRRHGGARKGPTETTQFDSRSISEALLSAIQSSTEGVSPAILKRLYFVLNHLCSNPQCGVDDFQLQIECDWIKVTFRDIQRLSDALFEELSQRFKDFFDALCNDNSDKDLPNEMCGASEMLNLLLRCCLLVLTLLQHHQKIVLEKGLAVLGILHKLSSVNLNVRKRRKEIRLEKSVSIACEYTDSDCTTSTEDFVASLHFLESSDSRIPLVTAILEVFLDELLVSGQLRPLVTTFDSYAARTCSSLAFSGHGDIGQLMEILSIHFYLSLSNEYAIEDFLGRLFWMHPKEFHYSLRAMELSPTAAAMLLLNPHLLSAPKFIQAHVFALISGTNGMVMDFKIWKAESRFVNCFLSVFESSVSFYKSSMIRWQIDGNHSIGKGSYKSNMHGDVGQLSFDSLLSLNTQKKVNHVISKLNHSSDSCLRNLSNKMKSDLLSSSIKYVKECQHVFDESCQDEMLTILSCIVQRASHGLDNAESISSGLGDLEDLCILASVLKLMGNSLLQVIWCLRHGGDQLDLKSLSDFSQCKEYDSILSTICYFTEFKIHLPVQKLLCNLMELKSTSHSESKTMFLHFSGLLFYAFTTGLDFLVKGCLLNIISVLNLFVFEEGDLSVLHSLFPSNSESIPSNFPSVNIRETRLGQNSTLVVASKIQKMRSLYSRTSYGNTRLANRYSQTGENAVIPGSNADIVGTEEEIEEASNGELYLRCVLGNSAKVSDFDDLSDFIECEEGKDYASWLKGREQFRKWKGEKMAVLRWKKKKKTWNVVKGKRT